MPSKGTALLTGAGFTHNFGAPLANDLWSAIVGHPRVQNSPQLRAALLSDFDFEAVYEQVLASDLSQDEKDSLGCAVEDAFEYVDKTVREWGFRRDAPHPVNVYKVQELINSFAGTTARPGFFFTLNQDLFVERHYYNGTRPKLPGIKTRREWFGTGFNRQLGAEDYDTLPDGETLDARGELLDGSTFYYLKLHGSYNWRSADGTRRMVIGQGKTDQIETEALLARYFAVFEEVLAEEDGRLLIIGYGFRDQHVNRVLADAVQESGLRVFIITPETPASLHDRLGSTESGRAIWSGLGGYYPWALAQMFPADQSVTAEWRMVQNQCLE